MKEKYKARFSSSFDLQHCAPGKSKESNELKDYVRDSVCDMSLRREFVSSFFQYPHDQKGTLGLNESRRDFGQTLGRTFSLLILIKCT